MPNLDIRTNDVKCAHASTVGPIDEDQRFYLESRGVRPEVAERLVVLGFFDEVHLAAAVERARRRPACPGRRQAEHRGRRSVRQTTVRRSALDELAVRHRPTGSTSAVSPVAVVRIDDDVYAIGDVCSHADVSLSEGEVWCDERELECPKHGSAFSLVTGEPTTLPATQPVPVYDAVVVDGQVIVVDHVRREWRTNHEHPEDRGTARNGRRQARSCAGST